MADTWSTNLTTRTPIETSSASGLGDKIGGFLSSINPFGAIASGIGSIFGGGSTPAGEGMNTNTQNTGIETAASAEILLVVLEIFLAQKRKRPNIYQFLKVACHQQLCPAILFFHPALISELLD